MDILLTSIHRPCAKKKTPPAFGQEQAKRVRAFHQTLDAYSVTPLVSLENLAAELGLGAFWVKDESKRFGLNAFKGLGGSYAMACLAQGRKNLTFVTATDGNHGRGVAWSAKQMGHQAVVYMPKGTAQERLRNIQKLGAHAEITDMCYDDTVRFAQKQAEEHGWILIQDTSWPGYEEIPVRIMQGYTTMGLEILEQLDGKKPTHIFLQAGVGSMAGAMAAFFADVYGLARPTVVVVEPNGANCVFRTADAADGALHAFPGEMHSIMAGLCCGEVCHIAWEALEQDADFAVSCPDWVAANGMRILGNSLGDDAKIISGESGAVTSGLVVELMRSPDCAALRQKLKLNQSSCVLCISTEGDTDRENYREIVWNGMHARPAGRR